MANMSFSSNLANKIPAAPEYGAWGEEGRRSIYDFDTS